VPSRFIYYLGFHRIFVVIIVLFIKTVSKFGKLDILVSNAAVNPTFGRTLDVSCV